jgi:cullin-associated NEDD8-dissociated protein 1
VKLTLAFVVCTLQHVRRAAVLALSTAAHNKPNLIKALLPELLPLLYDQTVVKVSFPKMVACFFP